MAGTTIRRDRGLPIELISHSQLNDMPDVAGTNSDHDARYLMLDGSNANQPIDIGIYDFTTTGIISGGTLTDGTLVITGGSITGGVNATFTGTISGGTLTDGTFIVTGGAITGASGNISMWTNDSGYLTPATALWTRVGTTLSPTTVGDNVTTTGIGNFGVLIVNTNTLVANVAGFTDRVGIGTATPAVLTHLFTNPDSEDTNVQMLRLDRRTTGTAASGISESIGFFLEDDTGNSRQTANLICYTPTMDYAGLRRNAFLFQVDARDGDLIRNIAVMDSQYGFGFTKPTNSNYFLYFNLDVFTANRTLTLDMNNVDRTLDLNGNLFVEATSRVNQDLTTDANVSFTQATIGIFMIIDATSITNILGAISFGNENLTTTGIVTANEMNIGNPTGNVPFIVIATIIGAGTTNIYNANAPIAFRVINAWSVNTADQGASAGYWKVTDGTNDITGWIYTRVGDTYFNSVATIDDAYHEIAVDGTLAIVNDAKLPATCIVYVMCMPI